MQYRLRTLLILLAILPPILGITYVQWQRYQEQERQRQRLLNIIWEAVGYADDAATWQAIRSLSQAAAPPPADNSNQDATPDLDGL